MEAPIIPPHSGKLFAPGLGLAHLPSLSVSATASSCLPASNVKITHHQEEESLCFSSDGYTPGRWWKCRRVLPPITRNYQRSPREFHPQSKPWEAGLWWRTEAYSGNHFILRFLYHAFLAPFSLRTRKIPPPICFPGNVTNLFSA